MKSKRLFIVILFVLIALSMQNLYAEDVPYITLIGHRDVIVNLIFSPDGRTLASTSGNFKPKTRLWDIPTGQLKATLNTLDDSLTFSPNGSEILGHWEDRLQLWDADTGKLITVYNEHETTHGQVFSPDGHTIAVANRSSVLLYDTATGKFNSLFTPHYMFRKHGAAGWTSRPLAYSPDGNTLGVLHREVGVALWDPTAPSFPGFALQGTPAGKQTVISFDDGTRIEIGTFDEIVAWHRPKITIAGNFVRFAFSPDNSTIATGGRQGQAHLWDTSTGDHKAELMGHTITADSNGDTVWNIAYSPNGTTIATSTWTNGVFLWDAGTGALKAKLEKTTREFVFSPDSNIIATGDYDNTARLWDTTTGEQIAVLANDRKGVRVSSVAFSPDGEMLAIGYWDGKIHLWNLAVLSSLQQIEKLWKVSGDNQIGSPNSQLTKPFVVEALGKNGELLEGVHVTFKITAGAGNLSETDIKTDADGRAQTFLTPGDSIEVNRIEASVLASTDLSVNFIARVKPQISSTPVPEFPDGFAQIGLPEAATMRLGKGPINDIAYSPEGNSLAVASNLGIWIYNAYTGEGVTLFKVPGGVNSVTFSASGNILASGGVYGNTVRLWDIATGQQETIFDGHRDGIGGIIFSPDGRTIAGSDSEVGEVQLWDVTTGRQKFKFKDHFGIVPGLAFSPDSQLIASGGDGPKVVIRDAVTGARKHILNLGYGGYVWDIAFSPDGKTLAGSSGSRTGTVVLWDVSTGKQKAIIGGHTGIAGNVAFSPDGTTVASASWLDNTVHLWDVATGDQKVTLKGHASGITHLAFSPDGTTVTSGSSKDGTIRFWDAATGQQKIKISDYTSRLRSIAFSPHGGLVASGHSGGTVRLWDVPTGKQLLSTRIAHSDETGSHDVYSLAFSPDGTTLVSGTWSKTIQLWDPTTGAQKFLLKGHADKVYSLAFSPDGTTLVSSSLDKTIRLWNPNTGQQKALLNGHKDGIWHVAFSPDGTTLASASFDKTVRLWNPATGQAKAVLRGHMKKVYSVAFSPDGSTLASGSIDGTVRLWNPATGQAKKVLKGHTQPRTEEIFRVAFSPDGTTLAAGSGHGSVLLWDTSTWQQKTVFKGHTDLVLGLAFSSDGSSLASGSWDGTVFLWGLTPRTVQKVSGDNQRGAPNSQLKNPLIVEVLDENGEPATGVSVTFRVTAGGGNLSGTNSKTDANGRARSFLTLGNSREVNRVEVRVPGSTDPVYFTARVEPQVLVPQSDRPPMYWIDTESGTLHRLTGAKVESLVPSVQNATSLAVDMTEGKLYWTEKTSDRTGKIRCADLDGSNVQLIKELTSVPRGIAVDPSGGKIYLANSWGKVQRLNLNGSGFQRNLITGLDAPKDIAVDIANGKIYWTEKTSDRTGKIRCADLDGSNVQLIKELTSVPRGIAVDPSGGKIYLANSWGKVQRLNLNGSGFQRNLITGLDAPMDVAVDVTTGNIYWTEQNSIRRAESNGKNIQNVITELGIPSGIVLGIVPPPVTNPAAPVTLSALPDETGLLPNYPNPFNPETWIPYQLAEPADINIFIYSTDGKLVRTLTLGHQPAGLYQNRNRAAYWDGRNELGEVVASGIYFYTLTAGDFTATRRMIIRK